MSLNFLVFLLHINQRKHNNNRFLFKYLYGASEVSQRTEQVTGKVQSQHSENIPKCLIVCIAWRHPLYWVNQQESK